MLLNLNRRKKKAGEIRIAGFTLIEIIVSLILFAIGIAFSARIFVTARYFIKEAENKSKAMKVASLQMERYLAYSYAGLEALIGSAPVAAGAKRVLTGTDSAPPVFNFTVTLTKLSEGTPTTKNIIPYIQIEVITHYQEENVTGTKSDKYVRLENMVTYPYIHIQTLEMSTGGQEAHNDYETISGATLELNNIVKKELLIFYNVSIERGGTIQPTDTVYTQCVVDGSPRLIETRTPILTQPLINNAIGVPTVSLGEAPIEASDPANPRKVEIQWKKDSASGTVKLKWLNLIVVEVEP
jgi:prepilin-type N-terminal cleavage/methylation domain-containing protein